MLFCITLLISYFDNTMISTNPGASVVITLMMILFPIRLVSGVSNTNNVGNNKL